MFTETLALLLSLSLPLLVCAPCIHLEKCCGKGQEEEQGGSKGWDGQKGDLEPLQMRGKHRSIRHLGEGSGSLVLTVCKQASSENSSPQHGVFQTVSSH